MTFQDALWRHAAAEGLSCRRVPYFHPRVEAFARRVRLLDQLLGEQGKSGALAASMEAVRSFRYRLTDTPLPLVEVARCVGERLRDADRLADIAQTVPQRGVIDLAVMILDDIRALAVSSDDPVGDGVRTGLRELSDEGVVGERRLVVVLRRQLALDQVQAAFGPEVDVLTAADAVALAGCGGLVVVGLPAWFEQRLFRCPPADRAVFVHPQWVAERPVDLTRVITAKPRMLDLGPVSTPGPSAGPLIPDEDPSPSTRWSAESALYASKADDGGPEVVTRLFGLASGDYAFFERSGDVQVVDISARDTQVMYCPVADCHVGDYLVVRVRGQADYVAPVADFLLGADAIHLRSWQRLWKASLRVAVAAKGASEIADLLSSFGASHASPDNVRRWAQSSSLIRPRDEADRCALGQLLDLGGVDESELWSAMERIDDAHHAASRLVRQRLLSELEGGDMVRVADEGWADFDVADIADEGALRVARVEWIDQEFHLVAVGACRRLFSGGS